MKKILYAESDFYKLRKKNVFYQDRTQFIETLENWSSNYPVFLRPRRFGKSLFITTLHHYYGLEHKEDFSMLFGDLYIGQHPTEEANSYMVLSFDFSGIDTATFESTYKGFLRKTLRGATLFMKAYSQFFTKEQIRLVEKQKSPEDVINQLLIFVKTNDIPHKIYLLIDEYDHFANELFSFDLDRFKSEVTKNGFVRKFYENLKLEIRDGIIGRLFITGVSPITMDSMTSGFNISSNITLNPLFHNMMGFTHAEVEAMLEGVGIPSVKIPAMMSDLAEWYDGYQFEEDNAPLFNPDMILYFLSEYSIKQEYPKDMLPISIVSDFKKILDVLKKANEEALLEELMDVGHIDFALTRSFNFTEEDFLSLLFYSGMLTFKEALNSDWRFKIPNNAIRGLFYEYLPLPV